MTMTVSNDGVLTALYFNMFWLYCLHVCYSVSICHVILYNAHIVCLYSRNCNLACFQWTVIVLIVLTQSIISFHSMQRYLPWSFHIATAILTFPLSFSTTQAVFWSKDMQTSTGKRQANNTCHPSRCKSRRTDILPWSLAASFGNFWSERP